jgi:PRTRC genetic system protein B
MQSKTHGFASEQSQIPMCAIVFYGSGSGNQVETGYATHHGIRATGSRFELCPGSSLTNENVYKIAAMVANGMRHKVEILPANVLASTDDLLVWWMPAGLQHMDFDVSMGSSSVPVPALVFMLRRSRASSGAYLGISVFALSDNARPGPLTKLFRAPLLNINEQGDVCWGSGVKPKGRAVSDIPAWQALFFSSVFTHFNGSSPIKGKDCYGFIADLLEAKATTFPVESLIPTKTTLQKVVDSMSGGSNHG